MAQQDQLGPFSEYLTKPAAAAMVPMPVPQVTGLESTGAAIGNIAMNFINGLRQGRMQKYAMQEAEREKQFNAYQHAIKTVAASDLPDQQKQMLHAKLSLPLIQSIAGDKNATSKQTGNPLTDVVKNVATGIIGGNVPKKGQPLSMEPVVEALQMASDPSFSRTRLASGYEAKIRARGSQIQKENPYADANTFMNDPEIQATIKQAEEQIGPYDSPYLKSIRGELKTPSYMERAQLKVLQEAGVLPGAQQGAPEASPAVSIAPSPGTTPTAGTTAAPPAERIGPVQLNPEALNRARAASTVPGFQGTYRLSPNTSEYEYNGKRVVVKPFQGMLDGKSVSGMLDESTNTLYPTGALTKQLRPGQYATEEVERAYNSIAPQIKEVLKGVDPRVQSAMLMEAEAYKNSGDMEGIKRLPSKASDRVIKLVDAEREAIEREKQASAGNARMIASLDAREKAANDRALTSAANAYLISPRKKALDEMSMQYSSFIGETPNLDIQGYLANPKGYRKKDGTPITQADLTLMDKSLARLIAKMTDDRSAVKQEEERGYNDLVGILQKAGINIQSVIGGGSNLGNDETRRALFGVISSIRRSLDEKAKQTKEERKASISHLGIDPETVNRSFGDYIGKPQSPGGSGIGAQRTFNPNSKRPAPTGASGSATSSPKTKPPTAPAI